MLTNDLVDRNSEHLKNTFN